MDFVRMYYNSIEVMPKILISHFLRYMGFYIEEITDGTEPSSKESSLDVYIVSEEDVKQNQGGIRINDIEKSIIIWIKDDPAKIENNDQFVIYRPRQNMERQFLNDFLDKYIEIFQKQKSEKPRLLGSVHDMQGTLKTIMKLYLSCEILQCSIYTRCFYEQDGLYWRAFDNYTSFIDEVQKRTGEDCKSDLVKYVKTYAEYELDIICKKNFRKLQYPVKELVHQSYKLVEKYRENEQILILKADIDLELDDFWSGAANEFADAYLVECAYAHYKRGRIIRKYTNMYDLAINYEKWAIRYKKDYFSAWYQIAVCYESQGNYEEAVKAFEQICLILDKKFKKHLLSPIEIEYLYKAVVGIVRIENDRLGNIYRAESYRNLAKEVIKEVQNTNYLNEVWSNTGEIQIGEKNIAAVIEDTMRRNLEEQCGDVEGAKEIDYENVQFGYEQSC